MNSETKRLFFGLEVIAPWPSLLPTGRYIQETNRHLTLAFLGQAHFPSLQAKLATFPQPFFPIGLAGKFDAALLLPKKHPNVVAWHVQWLENPEPLNAFQNKLVLWLNQNGFPCQNHEEGFLPHVTLCRKPFNADDWMQHFAPLPLFTRNIHLYESLGNSRYQSCWCYPIPPPIGIIDPSHVHFLIRGNTIQQLHRHIQIGLAFHHPILLNYFLKEQNELNNQEFITNLNYILLKAYQEKNCPFKAIRFYKNVIKEDQLYIGEIGIDV